MIIGYRRVSGKLPLSENETGARGTWLEKRRGLIKSLEARGHTFSYLSEPTPNSQIAGYVKASHYECDLLMLEFGGNNLMFNKKAWEETFAIIKQHKGKIVFLNDDPDLPFLWDELPDEDWSRWTVAVNAVNLTAVRRRLKVPRRATIIDMPFHAVLPHKEFSPGTQPTAIYYGRPNGRMKILQPYLSSGMLSIAGKAEEWAGERVHPAPEQKDRAEFYRQWRACFAVYDNKHKETGWRTGRAYHALLAGIPVAAPTGNAGLNWCILSDSTWDLAKILQANEEERAAIHAKQIDLAYADIKESYLKLGL